MKYKMIIFPLTVVLLASCSGNSDVSDAYGNFEATEVTISAQANGEIIRLEIEEGDFLNAGKEVGLIDTTDLYLKKQQFLAQQEAIGSKTSSLEAQVAVYEQQKINLRRDEERINKMFAEGAATQKQVDDIQGQLELIDKQIASVITQKKSVMNEVEAIRKQVNQVDESMRKAVIRNPVDGVVLSKYVNANELAVTGKPLYKLADMRELKLKVYVSGDLLPDVRIGNNVEVLIDRDKTTNRKLEGTVSWISESAEFTPKIIQTKEERVNLVYAVKIIVKNDGTLKIGMPGEVNF